MWIPLTALALYLAAAAWLAQDARRGAAGTGRGWLLPAILALLLHASVH